MEPGCAAKHRKHRPESDGKDPFHRYEAAEEMESDLKTAFDPDRLNEKRFTIPADDEMTKAVPIIKNLPEDESGDKSGDGEAEAAPLSKKEKKKQAKANKKKKKKEMAAYIADGVFRSRCVSRLGFDGVSVALYSKRCSRSRCSRP